MMVRFSQSYASGNVNGIVDSEYIGGLAGYSDGEISESYATGSASGDSYIGGLLGYNDDYIENSYSSGPVSGSNHSVGGLVGFNEYNIFDSYTVSPVSGDAEEIGGFTGYNDDTIEYSFWNTQTALQSDACGNEDCSSDAVGKTSSQMKSEATFTTSLGANSWDFDNTWAISGGVNNGYPFLQWKYADDGDYDGNPDSVENAGPNSGDANNDGILDSLQSNVTSFVNTITNTYSVLESNCSSNSGVDIMEEPNDYLDSGFEYPAGLMDFTLHCAVGGTATVTQYYYGDLSADQIVPRKYNSTTHVYTTIPNAVVTDVMIGGENAIKVVYEITDGGDLDQDGTANGAIVDPSGPSINTAGVPDTGLGKLGV